MCEGNRTEREKENRERNGKALPRREGERKRTVMKIKEKIISCGEREMGWVGKVPHTKIQTTSHQGDKIKPLYD